MVQSYTMSGQTAKGSRATPRRFGGLPSVTGSGRGIDRRLSRGAPRRLRAVPLTYAVRPRLPHQIKQVLARAADVLNGDPGGRFGVACRDRINDFAMLGDSLAQT